MLLSDNVDYEYFDKTSLLRRENGCFDKMHALSIRGGGASIRNHINAKIKSKDGVRINDVFATRNAFVASTSRPTSPCARASYRPELPVIR
jgi:hypothetical protein